MKVFYEMYGVGSSKYSVNYHDGKKKHADGSDFYDIALFKNKQKKEQFIRSLVQGGYRERPFGHPHTTPAME